MQVRCMLPSKAKIYTLAYMRACQSIVLALSINRHIATMVTLVNRWPRDWKLECRQRGRKKKRCERHQEEDRERERERMKILPSWKGGRNSQLSKGATTAPLELQ